MKLIERAGETLAPLELDILVAFLKEGGAVAYFKTARERLQSAISVVTCEDRGRLVGMGAVKARCGKYNDKIAKRSGWPLNPHKREIGFIAVEPMSRGMGVATAIVQELLKFDDRVFGVTSNPAMVRVFQNFRFQREGHEWNSKEGDPLSLWIKWQ